MRYAHSVQARLAFLSLALFATIVLLGLISVWSLSHSNEVANDVRHRWLPNIRLLGDLNNFTSDYRTAEANSLLAASPDELVSSLRDIQLLDQAVIRTQHDYEQIAHGYEELALYEQFSSTWDAYKVTARQVTALASAGRNAEGAKIYRGKSQITYDAASEQLGRLTAFNVALAARASERSAAAYNQARWLLGAGMAMAGAMLAVVITQLRRQISVPLLDLGGAMRRLAANDITVEIKHTDRMDEIGQMARAVVVFRANAVELMHSQRGLAQQATMLEEKLALEQSITQRQRNFISMITHEFRTPLTQIDAQAQRLTNLKDRLLPDDIADRAARIRAAVTRIIRMIDHLVDTTRVMDGEPDLFFHPEPMDLSAVLRDVCRLQRELSPNAQIVEDIAAEALPIEGDPRLLFQAFSNLMANAVKYSPGCARIVLRTRRSSRKIAVSIEDSGIGIPIKDLGHVFSRYYRGSNVAGFVGTGIGLFLAATVVRLHGGDIAVESCEGKGSRFTTTLPETLEV